MFTLALERDCNSYIESRIDMMAGPSSNINTLCRSIIYAAKCLPHENCGISLRSLNLVPRTTLQEMTSAC